MTRKIFRSIMLVAAAVLLLSFVLIFSVLYRYAIESFTAQLRSECDALAYGTEQLGLSFLQRLPSDSNRVTLVAPDGAVLFDNIDGAAALGNHGDREEIQEALRSGRGESVRYSDTLTEKTVNCAVRLEDGSVLRVSGAQYSAVTLLLGLLQPGIVVLAAALVCSGLLAHRAAKSILRPINEIDLAHPEQADVYEELSPLLSRLAKQRREIRAQMKELERKREEFAVITGNMSEGLLIVDRNMDILSFNASAARLFDIPPDFSGGNLLSLNRSQSLRSAAAEAVAGRHSERQAELGGRVYQLIANPVLPDGNLAGAVLVILDVTEKEERDRLRREFSANVSHELKTPLTSISGIAEIMANGLVKPEDTRRFSATIYQEASRLITLIDDIIQLARLDEGSEAIRFEPVDLYALSEAVLQRLQTDAEKKKLQLALTGEHETVMGSQRILDEILYNLCDNAVKYNKENGSVTVSIQKTDGKTQLCVADTGIGIPAADRERVFERFYRVDKSHSKDVGGTGLGLAIVKHGCALHHAAISLISQPDCGTTVTLTFPPA